MSSATFPATTIETLADLLENLGQVGPDRVRVQPFPGLANEADLIAVNARKRGICELVDGVLVEKVMGNPESMLALALAGYIRAFVIARNLGLVSGPDGMMRLSPGLVRVPDLAFVAWARVPNQKTPTDPVAAFVPNLAVEVLSPANTKAEMARKRREYFNFGVQLIWEVDPRMRTVTTYTASGQSTLIHPPGILDGGEVLPGFRLPLADLFTELDRSSY